MNVDEMLDETKELFAKADTSMSEGKTDEAIEGFSKALELQKAKYGEEHETVSICYVQLGMCHFAATHYDKALPLFKSALDINLKLFKYNTQEVANCYYLLASCNMQLEDYENAALNFGHVVLISTNLFGAESQQAGIARSMYNKAMLLNDKDGGEYEKEIAAFTDDEECFKKGNEYFDGGVDHLAIKCFEKCIDLKKSKGIEKDDKMVAYYRALSVAYSDIDMQEEALKNLEVLLKMSQDLYGEESVEVSGTYNFIGYIHLVKAEYDIAIDYMKKMQAINMKLYGEKSHQVIKDYSTLADVYRMKGDMDNALAHLVIVEGLLLDFPDESAEIDLATVYGNMAGLYAEKKEFDKQLEALEKMLKIVLKFNGEINKTTAQIYNQMAFAQHMLGNDTASRELLEKMNDIIAQLPEEDECGCGHDHHHHDDECDCGHDHHHHDDECDCGHDHH